MTITVDNSAVKRIEELRAKQNNPALMLRITVDGGGCSGFQYKMTLTDETTDKDLPFEGTILTDDISMAFLKGSTISFKDDLIGSEFTINNPNTIAGCGCGTSFSV